MGSCLPREDSQILFSFLEMFRREWTGNDGSWSPGEIIASKADAGRWNGDWGGKKKGKKDDMTGHMGKREKRHSFDPGREWLIMHMQTLNIPHINRNLFFPTSHQNWDSNGNEFVKSVNKCMQTYAHVQRFKYIYKYKCCFTLSRFIFFSCTRVSLYCTWCCRASDVVSTHMCAGQCWQHVVSWIVLPWMMVLVPGQTCQLGWHHCSDSW